MKVLLDALACSPSPGAASAQGQRPPAIQDQGEAYIPNFSEDQADQLGLLDFVKFCQEATGINFTFDEQTADLLLQARAVMLGTKRVPKGSFQPRL